ncbi:MAG: DUF488 family protein [Armatimonadota bacterium]
MSEIWSVGTSNRSPEQFLGLLECYGVACLADVRRFPRSRKFPHFDGEAFAETLAGAGIKYVHLGEELGGYRRAGYQAHMATEAFRAGLARLEALARQARTAFACAEKLPWRCHRRYIGDALRARGWTVLHIIEAGRLWEPSGSQPSLRL